MRTLLPAIIGIMVAFGGAPSRAETYVFPGQAVMPSHSTDLAPPVVQGELHIGGATDFAVMEPVIRGFQAQYPHIAITYHDLNTNELYEQLLAEDGGGAAPPDVAISSAMDQQIKLVNDGFAQRYDSPSASALPPWAVWRNEAFAFSAEPAVFVYNRQLLADADAPRSRHALTEKLRAEPERFSGRAATYDVERSGVGYLLATQDSKQSQAIWELAAALGEVGARVYGNSSTMLDAVASGEIAIAYNVLGSYALRQARQDERLGIIFPEDYTLLLSRIAFIPRTARHPASARVFLDYLLSADGQRIIATETHLYPVLPMNPALSDKMAITGPLRPIRLGPELLVFQDRFKRKLFLRQFLPALSGH